MNNLNTQQQLNQIRQQEAMRRAETQRRNQELTTIAQTHNSLHAPVLARIGSALSAAGNSLQRRYGDFESTTSDNTYGLESA